MRKCILLLFLLCQSILFYSQEQNSASSVKIPADMPEYWKMLAARKNFQGAAADEYIEHCRTLYLESLNKNDLHTDPKELVWIPSENNNKKLGSATINAGPCTNIDFESGNTTGWQQFNGYNPLTNPAGCCTSNTLIDQAIMSGGTDPFGGFPRVFPGSGNFSLRLGSSATGGRADRIQQTFFVTPANANFTYRYAVVLNDGGANHTVAQQPRFTSEIIDSLGNLVPCTFYNVSAGSSIAGYQTSSLTANGTAVLYRSWTSVAVDLTPNIGQNVTLRFTAFDCGPSGHFAYAYIDGFCSNFQTNIADTTCPNIPFTMCGPPGFGQYIWNGPGIANNTNSCISVSAPGVYTCQTILVPGCPGPTFTHTLENLPNPVLTFTPNTGICSPTFSFASTSSISAGSIASYTYSFGDGTGTPLQNPVHTFPGPGAYNVKFKAISARGCRDSIIQPVYVYPNPLLSFSPPSHCINTTVQFTNTSIVPPVTGVPPGTVTSYTWNLGNGQVSNLSNPVSTYTSSGTFTVTLTASSNNGCTATRSQTLGIFPPPIVNFSANPLCDINGTAFSPLTSTAVASGSIVGFFWNFGDGGTSNQANPIHIYNGPGVYTITFKGVTNNSCVDSLARTLTISPTPTIAFATASINACSPNFTFVNNSLISAGSISYSWNIGPANSSTLASPSFTFPGTGTYSVRLIGTSNMGCPDTAMQVITIYPYPVVTMSVPASCESALFTVSTTAVSGSITSFNWNFGDPGSGGSNFSNVQNPSHSYANVGNYVITLNIVSNLNCPQTFTQLIQVHPNPVTTFTWNPPDNCFTNIGFINNSGFVPGSPPGNTINSSLWNFNGAGSSTLTTPTYTFPGPGVYTVSLKSVTNRNCSSTQVQTLTIHPYPQGTISVLPSCLNIAAVYNSSFQIGQVPYPGSINSFTWNFGDGNFDNNANATHNYLQPGTYPVSFSMTSNQGCLKTLTASLVIFPVPSVNFNLNNICAGALQTFSNISTVAPGAIINLYKWDFETDGNTDSNLPNPVFSYSTAGTYTVQLYAQTTNNCKDSIRKPITVFDIPTPSITSSNVCLGAQFPYSGTLSTAGNNAVITTYNWNFGNNSPIVSQPSGTYLYPSPGNYTMSLTVTNNFNCSASTSTQVTIHQIPVPNFSVNPVCLGTVTNFTNTSSINQPDLLAKFRWDLGIGFIPTAGADTSRLFNLPGAYVVKLEAISDKQCSAIKVQTVIVHDLPNADFTQSVVCAGDKITMRNLSSASDGTIVSNAWDFQADQITDVDAPNPETIFPLSGSYPVTLKVTTGYGCSHSKTKLVNANPKAIPNFTASVQTGCPELCTNFKNLSTITRGSFTSKWDFGDGSPSSVVLSPRHCYSAGKYNVTLELKTDSGCKSSLSFNEFMNVFPNPVAAFNVEPEKVAEDDPTITVYSQAGGGDIVFTKYFVSDGSSFGTANFTHVIKNLENKFKPAVVQVVQNRFGCTDTLFKLLEVLPSFAIYVPNVFTPNADGKNDGFQAKGVGILKFAMQIYDRWGHLVWETKEFTDAWDGSVKGYDSAAKQDVYTWKAQVVDIFNEPHNLTGHVTLLR